MRVTKIQLLEIIKEELQKEIVGYDVSAVKVSHEAAEDLRGISRTHDQYPGVNGESQTRINL